MSKLEYTTTMSKVLSETRSPEVKMPEGDNWKMVFAVPIPGQKNYPLIIWHWERKVGE